MILTQRQLDVLNFKVVDGQKWGDHAEATFGVEKGGVDMLAKVARWEGQYDTAVAAGNYKTRAIKEEDARLENLPTPYELWLRGMMRTDRMGMPRYLEDLITDNPNFNIHEKMKTRYDEKVALRATKP